MSADRWDEATEQVVFNALCGEFPNASTYHWIDGSRAVLAALADAGLLVEPGSETRIEYVAESITSSGQLARRPVGFDPDVDLAPQVAEHLDWLREKTPYESDHRVMVRTVHVGPRHEVSLPTAAAAASGAVEPPSSAPTGAPVADGAPPAPS